MIVVRVELHSAVTGEVTQIGEMFITNDGTGTQTRGNYAVQLMRKGTARVMRFGRVEAHARLSTSVWKLVKKALESVNV
jgi:hypothetical protein